MKVHFDLSRVPYLGWAKHLSCHLRKSQHDTNHRLNRVSAMYVDILTILVSYTLTKRSLVGERAYLVYICITEES